MATTVNSSFQSMLNEYLPNRMIMEDLVKRDWFLSNLEIDNGWQGSKIIVPFKGAGASTVEFGQLASSNDISQSTYVRGSIDNYVEAWSSLIFNHRDLMDAEGKIPEATFLKILPGEVDSMVDYFKQVVSTQLGNGSHFAAFATSGTVGGTFEVDHIDRFQIGQKLEIDDNNSVPLAVYVTAIDVNTATVGTGTVTVSLTRGGGPAAGAFRARRPSQPLSAPRLPDDRPAGGPRPVYATVRPDRVQPRDHRGIHPDPAGRGVAGRACGHWARRLVALSR